MIFDTFCGNKYIHNDSELMRPNIFRHGNTLNIEILFSTIVENSSFSLAVIVLHFVFILSNTINPQIKLHNYIVNYIIVFFYF